ncbi:MAG: tRNA lysidine(34) synthetase TilS [Gammaproteobacteria bacterium]|nr:tRNA lysidine(34) synthetase TilS [Gammaproteobacteria bacterium]
MLSFIQDFFKTISPDKTLWVAYSGGMDSHVLLHLMKHASLPHKLRAVHVNHSLCSAALSWAEHCQRVCHDLMIPLTQIQIDARAPQGESPEDYARFKRYEALNALLNPGDALVTAHHQEDQAETFLLQLMRGAGLPGLAGMGAKKKSGAGYLLRPLLEFSQNTLCVYAQEEKLLWVEDESNQHLNFNRNYVRHRVLPLLKLRWPSAVTVLSRGASHCAHAQVLLQEVAMADWVEGSEPDTLSIPALLALSPLRQINVIRYWLQRKGLLSPTEKQLNEIIKMFLYGRQDAYPVLTLPHCEFRRFKENLYVFPRSEKTSILGVLYWDGRQVLHLPSVGSLTPYDPAFLSDEVKFAPARDQLNQKTRFFYSLFIPHENSSELSIRFRVGGERFHPENRIGSHPLKKLMQEWNIPPWERERVPLLYVNDELACVLGYAVSAKYLSEAGRLGTSLYFFFERGRS